MLLSLSKYHQSIAWFFVGLFYAELVLVPLSAGASAFPFPRSSNTYGVQIWNPLEKQKTNLLRISESSLNSDKKFTSNIENKKSGGPDQPEMQAFSSVNNSNMVDLFSGDFSYNIPLMDVGGYPINLSYRSGISMDQEASWVGLGWNVNPGTINRNMRGLPDDFDGRNDSIKKVMNIRENKTIGVTTAAGAELVGLPLHVGASMGVFHNTYKGWGIENGLNASINAGSGASGYLSGGLSLTSNTQEGVNVVPSISVFTMQQDQENKSGIEGSFSLSLPYNSRSGLNGLQLSTGIRQYSSVEKNQRSLGSSFYSGISFASPAFIPSITIPMTSRQFSFTAKTGALQKVFDANFSISGYISSQFIAAQDTLLALPAYGYLNFQEANGNQSALLDYNLEKDLPYREKPPVPHIAIPSYTYDAFSITGEGTGGMFRAYRSDIGFVHDHAMRTRDISDRASIDFGGGDIVHAGVDLNINRAYTQNGAWLENNTIRDVINFKKDTAAFEASYFRNPAEKSVNSKKFYQAVGEDDLVAVNLFQPDKSSSFIQATNYLTRYRNKRAVEQKLLKSDSVYKRERDKRTQVISYLTAKEADVAGLSRYIESYNLDTFALQSCGQETPTEGNGTGLQGYYFNGNELLGEFKSRTDAQINFHNNDINLPSELQNTTNDNYSIRWIGRIKAPVSGTYSIETKSDDGVRLWINDSLLINNWVEQAINTKTVQVNLLANEFYTIKIEYYERKGQADIQLRWSQPGQGGVTSLIAQQYLYLPASDAFSIANILVKEKRINSFRKPNHISEVSVLNNDGRRYVYGLPVYNLKQKEVTFAVNPANANNKTGLVKYSDQDNSTDNQQGIDNYYKSEEIPAYAHSFLLTGILSADYVDASGNGISDDDLGDAVKFNYSKVAGINNPFKWKTPYVKDSANYNQGLKTDRRDDKGNMVSGEKELWYLHSIESKSMVAFFKVEDRTDLLNVDEHGLKLSTGAAKRLKEINLYSKSDFAKKGLRATPIKTVHFEYGYDLCPQFNGDAAGFAATAKLTLRKVWFTYNKNDKGALNPYVFNYLNNPSFRQKAYDRWGNYKDPLSNPGSTVGNEIGNDEFPYALQDSAVAATNAAAWALDSIGLPSGGAIKVDYESDDYAFVQDKRAMNMIKPIGFASSPDLTSGFSTFLYDGNQQNNYIYVNLSQPVTNKAEFYRKYVQGIKKLFFRFFVQMPSDQYGGGSEYISGYADIDPVNGYGISNSTLGWIKVEGVSLKGDGPGEFNPMSKAAIQYLRLNLPSKAYPYSEPGDNLSAISAVKMMVSSYTSIATAFTSFDKTARASDRNWGSVVDLNRSLIRLNNPNYKKYGGGHRVKRIKTYDNWNKMVQRRGVVYGQEYTYTTEKEINGVMTTISSGVASYEPGIGGEENPFRQPIEYVEKASLLGPVTLGYSEEPLGESFFPSASVGYSKVKVRTINAKNTRSANGFEETQFYTTYDFPTYTDHSLLDKDTKKRFAPGLSNFLRINARHHIALSQGFKIELNDMNGRLRSQASYAETDLKNPIKYTENIYKTEDPSAEHKRLSNEVMVIDPAGNIDAEGIMGKDVELMVAMREQQSVNTGYNININAEVFNIPFVPGFFVLLSLLNLYQREENLYRSAATVKVIQRFGILDSVIHMDKGSKVSTKDILYDSETGDVLLSRTQNEFNDPVYNFTYPSHWAYDAMGLAYKNINVIFKHVTIKQGKIISGVNSAGNFFSSGDEIFVAGKLQTSTGGPGCSVDFSTFASFDKIWAIDSNVINGGTSQLYFIDRSGKPYNGDDITLKVIRSGRRNVLASVGAVTSLVNPVQFVSGQYLLDLGTSSKVLNAQSAEFKQFWKVYDRKLPGSQVLDTICHPKFETCADDGIHPPCSCICLRDLFKYLLQNNRLFAPQSQKIRMDSLIADANSKSLLLDYCPMLKPDSTKYFYAITTATSGTLHRMKVGDANIDISVPYSMNFTNLRSWSCAGDSATLYDTILYPESNTLNARMYIENYRDQVCDTIVSSSCKSVLTDTVVNPYTSGVLGNWRMNRSYTYYGQRAETDPASVTNIRSDGSFADFTPFWDFVSSKLVPQYDSARWVWNSEMTLFNRKGFEIENKDPLGRYNSGLYGYNLTMPVAVVQNSRYRESGFDGFEDYDFTTQLCDTVCAAGKQMDFTAYKANLDTLRKHSGKISLRLNAGTGAGLSFPLSSEQQDTEQGTLNFNLASLCSTSVLQDIKMSDKNILPSFSPLKGKRMLLSAWVREDQDCKCNSYEKNAIVVDFGGSSITFHPNGSIIEGWQRYESVFDIPSDATSITVSLQATNDVAVNFDDLRIHPYNANMKSFVFHPVNLRLMAELDENNYATFYEYDDDGTLIRLKKETQRGIKTIKETRSALIKE